MPVRPGHNFFKNIFNFYLTHKNHRFITKLLELCSFRCYYRDVNAVPKSLMCRPFIIRNSLYAYSVLISRMNSWNVSVAHSTHSRYRHRPPGSRHASSEIGENLLRTSIKRSMSIKQISSDYSVFVLFPKLFR